MWKLVHISSITSFLDTLYSYIINHCTHSMLSSVLGKHATRAVHAALYDNYIVISAFKPGTY